jgi:hypothetical protein
MELKIMARPATAQTSSFWEVFAQAMGNIAPKFTDAPRRRESHLEELRQETDRIGRMSRHWLM